MTDSNESDGATIAAGLLGCAGIILHMFLALPLWYVILFTVLSSIEAPAAIWACYWLYVPAGILSAACGEAIRAMK